MAIQFNTLINAAKQVRQKSISKDLLNDELLASINQIETNKNNISAIIASKGVANGIATLGADGRLISSQLPAIAVSDYLGEAASLTALYALAGQRGDWATVVPSGDATKAQSFMRIGEGNTAADWREISTPSDGVTSLRNTSGSITGLNGVVTLANVAFSGAATDVSFSNVNFTATNVSAALIEVMTKEKQNETDIANLETQIANALVVTKIKKAVNVVGTIDGANKTFSITETFVPTTLEVYFGGQYLRPTIDYTVSGQNITLVASPDFETERPFVNYVKA